MEVEGGGGGGIGTVLSTKKNIMISRCGLGNQGLGGEGRDTRSGAVDIGTHMNWQRWQGDGAASTGGEGTSRSHPKVPFHSLS